MELHLLNVLVALPRWSLTILRVWGGGKPRALLEVVRASNLHVELLWGLIEFEREVQDAR
jgi:hypothetical protein